MLSQILAANELWNQLRKIFVKCLYVANTNLGTEFTPWELISYRTHNQLFLHPNSSFFSASDMRRMRTCPRWTPKRGCLRPACQTLRKNRSSSVSFSDPPLTPLLQWQPASPKLQWALCVSWSHFCSGLWVFVFYLLLPQYGTVDTEIKVHSAENPELLKVLPSKFSAGQVFSLFILVSQIRFPIPIMECFPNCWDYYRYWRRRWGL